MAEGQLHRASTTAPVNIAVIKFVLPQPRSSLTAFWPCYPKKPPNSILQLQFTPQTRAKRRKKANNHTRYWGKRDTKLNLPTNSSISVTLSQSDLRTLTTASCSATYPDGDSLTLNNEPSDITGARTQACFRELRARRARLEEADSSLPKLAAMPLRLVSENNFPTAAGLASSAAGFAALVQAIANLYQLPDSPSELSLIARQGSGSACRSLFGGYVAWRMGSAADGTDSKADQVAPASHWPQSTEPPQPLPITPQ